MSIKFYKRIKAYIKNIFYLKRKFIVEFISLEEMKNNNLIKKINIAPELKVQCSLPQDNHFIKKNDYSINAINAYLLKDVFICPDITAFLDSQKKKLFYEKWDYNNSALYSTSFLQDHDDNYAKILNVEECCINYPQAIFLGGTFTFNYYHFLLEIIAKTEFLNEIPNSKNIPIVMDSVIKKNKNLHEIAKIFTKNRDILFLDSKKLYKIPEIWHITSPNYTIPNVRLNNKFKPEYTKINPNSIKYLRSTLLSKFNINSNKLLKYDKVFIRRKSKSRQYNEEEILLIAEKYGFQGIYFEDLNIHEQMYIFQESKYIIGPSGAAWTNLIYASPKTKALCWVNQLAKSFTGFSTIAAIVGADLHYFFYEVINETDNVFDIHSNYHLSLSFFEEKLQNFLELK